MENYVDVYSELSAGDGGGDTGLDIEKCVIEFANSIINACKDIKVNQDIQETERLRIRTQAKICVAMIEADTIKFENALKVIAIERMEFVNAFCTLVTKDVLDENTVKISERILDYLSRNSPLDLLNSKNTIPLIGR
ncbi:hypothetical protein LI031_00105 [Enterocloster citroniae]|uniref:hypothetical protein n=1 Tax=Enterocloster citroniae TaxID=358743 RepID=UPI001D06E627|nr:hypothetical protein [Enterocloster citroniae]MCB7062228.1 hypothetical protein [Enterocloster citroniae]